MNRRSFTRTASALTVAVGAYIATHQGSATVLAQPVQTAPAPGVVGNTDAARYWELQTVGDCMEQSARVIIGEMTGSAPSGASIDAYALTMTVDGQPFYNPLKGSHANGAPALYAHYGLNAQLVAGDIQALETSLVDGQHVAVFVNGEQLWAADGFKQKPPIDVTDPDHVVVLDEINEVQGTVTLTDTGEPKGAVETVPLSVFESSWATSGNEGILVTK